MPTRPDPAQPNEDPALEPIRVLRPRRTDALAELFKELEQERNGYETVVVPGALPGAEDATQELPAVTEETRIAPRGTVARPGPGPDAPGPDAPGLDAPGLDAPGLDAPGPGFRRAAVAVAVTAAAVIGFGGALLLSGRDDDRAAAKDPAPSTTASASAAPTRNAPGAGGAAGAPGADEPGDPPACSASFRTVNSWQGGYQGEVTVTGAPAASAAGWTATVVPADGARLTQVWDGTLTTTGDGTATVANASWNGKLAPGASVTFGFIADTSASGAPSAEVTCAATADAT
ncbi:cellulose binding domain-containing protein [Streptomyces sp. NBC_00299]|uniref:cellulose binding domain-containing protein n=1 Tax=Streptomyces sp. NBC_00299 TaxID=2975705 RepID=UPI002E2DC968|nr:cellulose binding domain-containing protein [Streptomyces sp. NBC_00299]